MPTPLKILLQQLGLTKKESDVYLASTRLGEAEVSEIAQAAGLPRTTTASILERLRQQGFLTCHAQKGKRIYWIEDPHVIVEKEKARLGVFEQISSRLHTEYHRSDRKPQVEVFDTREAIMTLMAKVIEEVPRGGEFCVWESPAVYHYQQLMTDELFHELSKQKTKKNIRTCALIPAGHETAVRKDALQHLVQVRVLPEGLAIETSQWVFGDSVVLLSGTHTFAVRITHRHTAESYRSLFEFLWAQSRVLG